MSEEKHETARMFGEESGRPAAGVNRVRTTRMFEDERPRSGKEAKKRRLQNALMLAAVILLALILAGAIFLQHRRFFG